MRSGGIRRRRHGLLLTDPAAEGVRPTVDVDAIVEAGTLPQFHRIEAEVAARGFARAVDSGAICRWRHRASGVLFDLMPVDAGVLGFSNPWYADAVRTAMPVTLGEGVQIHVVAAPAFVATKLEAFASRGAGDILASHDLEDVLNVVDGRGSWPQNSMRRLWRCGRPCATRSPACCAIRISRTRCRG